MDIRERIAMCRLLEMMEKNKDYCESIGLENESTFNGRSVMNTKETNLVEEEGV